MFNKKNILWLVSSMIILVSFSACSNKLPSTTVVQNTIKDFKLPKLPENGKAIVYVVRPELLGGAVKFNVFIDDKNATSEMGYTQAKEYIYFNIQPGSHKILSLAENWDTIEIDAKEGDIIFIEQEPKMGILYARNKLHLINDQASGKYRVKTLTVGNIKKLDK